MNKGVGIFVVSACLGVGCVSAGFGQNLIDNGGFESGFASWTRIDQLGSDGSWLQQTGTASPINGLAVPAPPGGTNAAMTDAQGPGTHVLYQDFIVPSSAGNVSLSFDFFLHNYASAFSSPNTLDFSTPTLNQQFRVDIMTASSDPFSVAIADVLQTIYRTLPGDPLVSGYTTIVADLTALFAAHAGQTLRLRFADVDNVTVMNAGIDNIRIATNVVAVPEAARSFGLLLTALGAVGIVRLHFRVS